MQDFSFNFKIKGPVFQKSEDKEPLVIPSKAQKSEGLSDVDWALKVMSSIEELKKGSSYFFNDSSQKFEKKFFSLKDTTQETLEKVRELFDSILKSEELAYKRIRTKILDFIFLDSPELELDQLIQLVSAYQSDYMKIRQSAESALKNSSYIPQVHEVRHSKALTKELSLEKELKLLKNLVSKTASFKEKRELLEKTVQLDDLLEISNLEHRVHFAKILFGCEDLEVDQTPQKALIQIAKRSAKEGLRGTDHYEYLGITDRSALREIAKIDAKRIVKEQSQHSAEFPYKRIPELAKNQHILVELIKLLAQEDSFEISTIIRDCKVQEERDRIEIAKFIAKNEASAISMDIQNFDIQSEQARIEIAKIAAQQNGWDLSDNIENYNIKNQQAKHEIFILACLNQILSLQKIENYELKDECYSLTRRVATRISQIKNSQRDQFFKDLLAAIEELAQSQKLDLGPLCSLIKKEKNEQVAGDQIFLLILALLECGGEGGESLVDWLNNHQREVEALFLYRKPEKRLQAMKLLFETVLSHPKEMEAESGKNRGSPIPHLLLTALYARGKLSKARFLELGEAIGNNPSFRKLQALEPLVETLTLLARDDQKSREDVEFLLTLLIPKREIMKPLNRKEKSALDAVARRERSARLNELNKKNREELAEKIGLQRNLIGIYDFSREDLLTRKNLAEKGRNLADIFQKTFREAVPCKEVKDFQDKYFKTFGASRDPQAIVAYAAKATGLNNPNIKKALETFISDVLEGSFVENRYLKEKSLHLKELLSCGPDIFSAWQKGLEISLSDALAKSGTAEEDELPNFKEILERKLMREGHLGDLKSRFPELFAYFKKEKNQEALQKAREEALTQVHRSSLVNRNEVLPFDTTS